MTGFPTLNQNTTGSAGSVPAAGIIALPGSSGQVLYNNGGAVGAESLTPSMVGLGNVANNAQTLASVVPNTAPSAGQVLLGNAGGTAYAPQTVGGDCSLANSGAITCTKTNGTVFAASATTNALNASNITSGTLPHAQLPALVSADIPNNSANTTGTAANVTGTVAVANGGTGLATLPGSSGQMLYNNGGAFGAKTLANSDLPTATVMQKFFGTSAPGSVSGNLPGDLYEDTTNHVIYACNAPSGTAAPACTTVAAGGWTQLLAIADPSKTGFSCYSGITSGMICLSVADVAGSPIVYLMPSTAGTAGQFMADTGAVTCPTLPASAPATCHQMAWVSVTATLTNGVFAPPWGITRH